MSVLPGSEDHYDGIIIDTERLSADPDVFAGQLAISLREWESKGKRGVWLRLPLHLAPLLQPAIAAGFDFHHARPGCAVLTKWLPKETLCTIPESILYSVGIGAFVLNSQNEVLLVQEANGILKGKGIWKFPTGLAEAGEDVHAAAEREVLEETGISAKFDRVLAIRQSHGLLFGKSDLFFVCALRMEPGDQKIVVQESELDAAAWHPLELAAQMPIFCGGTFSSIFAACRAYAEAQYSGFGAEQLVNSYTKKAEVVLHGYNESSS